MSGALHWDKQLFNGTVITVESLKVLRREAGTGPKGNRLRANESGNESEVEPSALIAARTDDGRRVSFRHDEIRDWYGNIRLDHGYALTIAAAQGLTVDRTFLLADDRPARETIYPAATRHREEIDIYVNRAPLALDVADRRPDNDREAPVVDSEIRAYLAERWSRSRPKEAALDYMAAGDWEERQEDIEARQARRRAANARNEGAGEARSSAANDNALTRIARDVRRTAFVWRHGRRVDAFATGRQEVLAAWEELRARTRTEGDAVALGDAHRETLDRHAALLKQAAPFRARPEDFAALLADRAGIGRSDLDEFEALHDRASRHRRAATMRQVHRKKREAEQRPGERPQHGEASGADAVKPTRHIDTVPPPDDEAYAWARGAAVGDGEPQPTPDARAARPDWWPAYESVVREWNALVEDARQAGTLTFYARGYAGLIPRIQALADISRIPAERRAPLMEALKNHDRHLAARGRIEDYLVRAQQHIEAHGSLRREALDGDIEVAEAAGYPVWKRDADGLIRAGEAILADRRTYGAHLANIATAETRIEWALTDIARTVRQDDAALREAAVLREELEEVARDKPDPREAARERARQAERDAREYSRLQSAVHNARSQQEREAAQTAFDDYRKREDHKYEEPGEHQRQSHTRKRSRHWRMRP